MKLRVLWLGRPAASPFEDEVASYRARVARRWPAEDVPLRPAAGGRDTDPGRSRCEEAELVRRHVPAGWWPVALDEGGEVMDSVTFAHWLEARELAGAAGLAFVIGSDLGIDRDLVATCRTRLSLSALTLPHLLARLLLWEQLFRATHILGGGGYHRSGGASRGLNLQ